MARIASATLRPCDASTSTCRSLATISLGLCPFFAISVLLRLEAIPRDGPLRRGRINFAFQDGAQQGLQLDRLHLREAGEDGGLVLAGGGDELLGQVRPPGGERHPDGAGGGGGA